MFNSHMGSADWIEVLEGRQLLSAALPSGSALLGTYAGEAIYGGGARSIKLKIAAKSETLIVAGEGSAKMALNAAKVTALEAGTFSYTGSIRGDKLVFSGSISDSDTLITGTFTGRGKLRLNGTFSLTKL